MQLAKIQRDGKLVLQPEAIKHLRTLGKGILVVAVFGGARSAKSTTANMLLGKQSFNTSNTTDACTLGVWIDSKPLGDGRTLLVVDSEGMGKGDTSQHPKILGLVSVLASDGGVLIDNEMKDLNEHNFGTLGVLATMTKMLRGATKHSWPALIVLLRDFTLEMVIGKRVVSPTQYLQHLLEDPGDSVDETRKLIREAFIDRDLFTFAPPSEQERISMLNLPPGAFKTTFEAMKTHLFKKCLPKTLIEDECDGGKLADFLDVCVGEINKEDGVVDIPNAHDVLVERFCRRLIDQLEQKYSEAFPEKELTGDEAKLLEKHTSVRAEILESYDKQLAVYETNRVKQYREELEKKISGLHKFLAIKNAHIADMKKYKKSQPKTSQPKTSQPKKPLSKEQAKEELMQLAKKPPPPRPKPLNKPVTTTYPPVRPDLQANLNQLKNQIEDMKRQQQVPAQPQIVVNVTQLQSPPTSPPVVRAPAELAQPPAQYPAQLGPPTQLPRSRSADYARNANASNANASNAGNAGHAGYPGYESEGSGEEYEVEEEEEEEDEEEANEDGPVIAELESIPGWNYEHRHNKRK